MNIRITFHGLDHATAVEDHARKKLAKIEKFLAHEKSPVTMIVVITHNPNHAHDRVAIHIDSPGYHVVAHREGNVAKSGHNLYQLIDEVIEIAHRDLCKAKERGVDSHKKGVPTYGKLPLEMPEADEWPIYPPKNK